MAKSDILLESGTNEVEILEFILGGQSFGINVAKVVSIEQLEETNLSRVPNRPKEILGMYQYRGTTIPIIELSETFSITKSDTITRPLIVALEFNQFTCGLLVDGVDRIHRVRWDSFESLRSGITKEKSLILGTITIDEHEVLIIDIESIAAALFSGLSMEIDAHTHTNSTHLETNRQDVKIILAEDSMTIRSIIIKLLSEAGYNNLHSFENGELAWDHICKISTDGDIKEEIGVVISDIEMPKLDGLALCKKFRDIEGTSSIPVIMFSSLINEQMAHKCESVGANKWVTKPQIHTLIEMIDELKGITINESVA